MVNKQVYQVVDFARRLPHFLKLPANDQRFLLKHSWNEVLILTVAYLSTPVSFAFVNHEFQFSSVPFPQYIESDRRNADGSYERRTNLPQQMCLGSNYVLGRNTAVQAGVVQIFDRVMSELSIKIKRLDIDQTELACLKAIIVFNPGSDFLSTTFVITISNSPHFHSPDVRILENRTEIDLLRAKIYACLDEYCRTKYPNEDGRFAQLLLRLPALRSISLKCLDYLFYFRLIDDKQIEDFTAEQLNKAI